MAATIQADLFTCQQVHLFASEQLHLYLQIMKYGERLKQARTHAELTQSSLATKIGAGMTQAGISYLEKSEATGSEFTVQLAQACGVRPEWLALESGPMIDEYKIAEEIASKLDAKGRAAWYRAGRALAEPDEPKHNGTQ